MERTLYVSTTDDKGKGHRYRLPLTETVPDGHEITDVRKAGQFRLTQVLSTEDIHKLTAVDEQVKARYRRTRKR